MKKILLLLSLPIASFAQSSFIIRPVFAYSNTNIHNKEDKKGHVYPNGASVPMPYTTSFSPSYGIELGLKRLPSNIGIRSMTIGIEFLPFVQKYKGIYWGNNNSVATATTKLNYNTIPIQVEFALLGNDHKIIPTISAGINIFRLSKYSDNFNATTQSSIDSNAMVNYYQYINNNILESFNGVYQKASFNTWYYKKNVLNSMFSIGAFISISKKIDIECKIINTISLNNPESSDIKEYKLIGQNFSYYNPYVQYINKVYYRNPNSSDVRSKTHLIQTGIQLACTYTLHK